MIDWHILLILSPLILFFTILAIDKANRDFEHNERLKEQRECVSKIEVKVFINGVEQ